MKSLWTGRFEIQYRYNEIDKAQATILCLRQICMCVLLKVYLKCSRESDIFSLIAWKVHKNLICLINSIRIFMSIWFTVNIHLIYSFCKSCLNSWEDFFGYTFKFAQLGICNYWKENQLY